MFFASAPAAPLPWNLAPDQWLALFVLCIVLIIEAWIDFTELRVPNRITYPMILMGWLYAIVRGLASAPASTVPVPMELWPFGLEFSLSQPWAEAAYLFWCSVKLTFLGFGLLIPLYAIGGMGAGDVKMQMGFGAWVATIFGYPLGWNIVLFGFCFAAVIGGVISAIMVWWQGSLLKNKENVREIVGDWFGSKNVKEVAEKAAARKPRLQLLPYGVPLCIGFIGYLALDYFGFWADLWNWSGRMWS